MCILTVVVQHEVSSSVDAPIPIGQQRGEKTRVHACTKGYFLLEQLGSFFPCWKIPSIINTQLFSLLHVKNLELKTNHIFNFKSIRDLLFHDTSV